MSSGGRDRSGGLSSAVTGKFMNYDCLVIGLGGMGSSALYHLARRGLRVCGLDQFGPAHARGSSHGNFRIFRKAYFEHSDYVPLLQTAEQLWRQLESESQVSLYHRIGVLLSGPADGEAVPGTLAAAEQHGLTVEVIAPSEAARRWPLLRFPETHRVVLDADAGILAVEHCVAQHLERAAELGAETCFYEQVQDWKLNSGSVIVRTDKATRTAESVVIAGGAWSRSLLSAERTGVELPPMQVLHKLQLWHTVDRPSRDALSKLPAFYFETENGAFYGMRTGLAEIKLARHTQGAKITDPSNPGEAAMLAERVPCVEFAGDFLPGINTEPFRTSGCFYTTSPDGHFIVDHAPECSRIVFATGFSGHGFKFASVIGAALADLATTGRTNLPIDFLSSRRFQ